MFLNPLGQIELAVFNRAHQVQPSARRKHFQLRLLIGRANGQTSPASNATLKFFVAGE
jgi:hypothetical protein